jgi:DNA-binding FadR family transcriptional regulator
MRRAWTRWTQRRLRQPQRQPQGDTTDTLTDVRQFREEVRELRRMFELEFARLASEQTARACHAELRQITALLIVSQEQAKALELWQQSTQDSHR